MRCTFLPWGACVFLAAWGCGRAHDLGFTSASATGGAGGATLSSSSSGSGTAGNSGGATSSDKGTGGAEPSGATALTLVNGVNDYAAVRFCFLPGDDPFPPTAVGMAFASSAVISPLGAVVPLGVDVTVWAIAGDLLQTAGKSCTAILALAAIPSAPIVARPLARIPASVFTSGKSLLLVSNGCLGGLGHDDPAAASACGVGYTSATPTAGVTLAAMSRIKSTGHISLQAVSASTALSECDVRVQTNLGDVQEETLVASLSPGAIGPTPPFSKLTRADFGPLDSVRFELFLPGNVTAATSVLLNDIFATGTISAGAFDNGASFALVAVGSSLGFASAKWWHATTVAIVLADPG